MRYLVGFFVVMVSLGWAGVAMAADARTSHEAIIPLLEKACDWQLSILPTEKTGPKILPAGWVRAAFYTGAMALYDVGHEQRFLNAMIKIGEENHWLGNARTRRFSAQPGDDQLSGEAASQPYLRHADDLAVGQLYCELYFIKHDEQMIAPMRQRLDAIMAEPMEGRKDWWWCDSVFMAPPTFAEMSKATGDPKYLDFMNRQFWDMTDFLYDKNAHLYFRDKTYFTKKEKNGQPVFWSRGNGWVMAGLARVMAVMPADYPDRGKYVALFREMADKIASLQQSDGFWRVSLLDPDSYQGKETSGTGFYTFALAWGINNGILPREKFEPVVKRAWAGLVSVVNPETGMVGWVQPIGAAPAAVKESNIAEYGTGALLLAGTEVWKMK